MAINEIPATNEAYYREIEASDPPKGIEVDTPRGKETDNWEIEAKNIFEAKFPSKIIRAPKLSLIDWIIVKNGKLAGISEHKTRLNITPNDMLIKFGNKWILSANKIEGGKLIASMLNVDLWGTIYFLDTAELMLIRLWSSNLNDWLVDIEYKETETQKGINGGKATRLNAFITLPPNPLIISKD